MANDKYVDGNYGGGGIPDFDLDGDMGYEKPKGFMDVDVENQSGHLMVVASPEDIEKAHGEEMAAAAEQQKPDRLDPLVSYFMAIVQENLDHRQTNGVDDALIDVAERVDSRYSDTKLAQIREYGGSEIYMGLTGVKRRSAVAWMGEVLTTDKNQLWRIEPTPLVSVPEKLAQQMADLAVTRIKALQAEAQQAGTPFNLTPQIVYDLSITVRDEVLAKRQEDAIAAAGRMEQLIRDQLVEMNFECQFDQFLDDIAASKVAILKGPVPVAKKVRVWDVDERGSNTVKVETHIVPCVYRVDPYDFYPSAVSNSAQKGNTVERVAFDRADLYNLIGSPGYSEKAIRAILGSFESVQDASEFDTRMEYLKNLDMDDETIVKTTVEGWEVYAYIPGSYLLKHGFTVEKDNETPIDPMKAYDVNAVLIDHEIIYLGFSDCCYGYEGDRPYWTAGWGEVTGSFWYQSIAELMKDIQDVCNASARALCNNMAFASGPQTVINDIERLPDGEELTPPHPLKLWQFTNRAKNAGKPLDFFQPNSNAAELIGVYDRFANLADDYTGIPAYAYGNDRVAGAGRTASGLSMLMNSAARGIKKVILRIDNQVLRPIVKALYYYNLQYASDPLLKKGADVNIQASGAIQVMIKEQMAARRMEFLQATANPLDFKLMDEEGRAAILREIAVSLELEADPVKTRDAIRNMIRQEAQAAQQARQAELDQMDREARLQEAEIAVKAAEAALKDRQARDKIDLEREKLAQSGGPAS